MEITVRALNELRPYEHNPKTHPKSQVDNIARSIQDFGFRQPLVIDGDGNIVCGHGRYLAAAQLGMTELPCVMADDLTPAQSELIESWTTRLQRALGAMRLWSLSSRR